MTPRRMQQARHARRCYKLCAGGTRCHGVGGREGPLTLPTPPLPPDPSQQGHHPGMPGPLPPKRPPARLPYPRLPAPEGSPLRRRPWRGAGRPQLPPPLLCKSAHWTPTTALQRVETPTPMGPGDHQPPESRRLDLHNAARHCCKPQGTHAALPRHQRPARPSASATGMAHNVMRWTTQTGGTVDVATASDAAGNVTVRLALSGFLPSLGAILHHNAHALRIQLDCSIMAAGAPSWLLAVSSSEDLEGGRARTPIRGGVRQACKGRGCRRPGEACRAA